MKRRARTAWILAGLLAPFLLPSPLGRPAENGALPSPGRLFAQENVPGQKPAFDYMSSYLSRNTNPLGLEEDKEIRDLRVQPSIKWVVRAGWRHALK
jgi:hypothetical protein